jgi:DNA-binding CsgD family transcriptional regulator
MVMSTRDGQPSQVTRLRIKSQDQRLRQLTVQGAGVSPWVADAFVEKVHEVYFEDPTDTPIRSGQLRYECVAATEGAGKPLRECRLQAVVLTLIGKGDVELRAAKGAKALRQRRIVRLAEEACGQDGHLSQEDIASILSCDVRTIRRDVGELREQGILVPTRGQCKDMGPGVTHREEAVTLWLHGHEPLDVARRLSHSLTAIERYTQCFARVVFLLWKKMTTLEIALALGISPRRVQSYIDLYHKHRRNPQCRHRLHEIEIIAGPHYEAEDEKKGPSLDGSAHAGRSRP